MNIRIQRFLLIAFFAVAHIIVQPLVLSGCCVGAVVLGGEGCCCSGDDTSVARSGCCSEPVDSDYSSDESSDSKSYDSSCNCETTPPAPAALECNQSVSIDFGEGFAALEAVQNPLHSSARASLGIRTARPPNQPPRVAQKAASAFTQVFRL